LNGAGHLKQGFRCEAISLLRPIDHQRADGAGFVDKEVVGLGHGMDFSFQFRIYFYHAACPVFKAQGTKDFFMFLGVTTEEDT
jgi:hypothetical protein